jgi:hypothetical protein
LVSKHFPRFCPLRPFCVSSGIRIAPGGPFEQFVGHTGVVLQGDRRRGPDPLHHRADRAELDSAVTGSVPLTSARLLVSAVGVVP